ncbi:MAG TPA: aryl-sulfate sulfotransferase [Candidatus Nanoarchaeia archaeon]|nr:aryl-sulfate sulfotransferase [Candidatus Nanoarchaeia archaeon]
MSRNIVILIAALLFMFLFISSNAQLVHPQTTPSVVLPVTIATYGNAWAGNLTFGVSYTSSDVMFQSANLGYVVVMNSSNGYVSYSRESNEGYGVVKNVGLNTVMFQGEPVFGGASTAPVSETHFWNYVTNTTVDFPNVAGHHDIEYNPINNTFLTLNDYVRQVGDNWVLYDKIVLLDPQGNLLWSWDTYGHIPLSDVDQFNMTSTYDGVTVMDLTHANTLDWDYNNSIIYLNIRNTNTFYAINQTTGNIMWACGEYGNFTLLNGNGTPVSSLWYHSHDLKQEAPNVFSMFDNDFQNVTNPDNCQSRLIDVTLNMTSMTAWVSWSYTAPTNEWSEFFGGNLKLPNGDRIGDFGTPTHQYTQNQPWIGNDTGATLIEVNQTGQVVQTITFPAGWQIYRIDDITNTTPFTLKDTTSTPTQTPYPTQLPAPTVMPTSSPTSTPSPSLAPTPSLTLTPTPSPAAIQSPTSTLTPTPSSSPHPLETATQSPIQSATPLMTPQATALPSIQMPTQSNLSKANNTPQVIAIVALLATAVAITLVVPKFYRRRARAIKLYSDT